MSEKISNLEYAAYAYFWQNYLSLEDIEIRQTNEIEKNTINKDLYNKLSKDAKEVACLIFEAPQEIINQLKNITISQKPIKSDSEKHIFNQRRLFKYFEQKWGTTRTKRTFNELKTYANNLE